MIRFEEFTRAVPHGVVRGEARVPDAARGAVMLLHGFKGFGRWGFFPLLAERLAEAGFVAVTFDFSGSGVGPDREHFTERGAFAQDTFGRALADVRAVVDEAERRGWIADGARYGVLGHSRGGGTALLHATEAAPRVATLVTWAAIGHVQRYDEATRRQWRERGWTEVTNARTGEVLRVDLPFLDEVEAHAGGALDLEAAARRVAVPWLILHGEADESVPPDDARRLAAAAPGATLALVPEANHVFGAQHPLGEVPPILADAVRRTVDFFREHCPPAGGR